LPSEIPELPEHERSIYLAIGRLAVEWNRTEERLRAFLSYFINPQTDKRRRGHLATQIVVLEMGTVGVTQALNAIADSAQQETKDAIEWITEYYDRLRGYRNYFVHCIDDTTPSSDLGPLGVIITLSAKGELVQDKDFITAAQIHEIAKHCEVLRTYIQQVLNYLGWGYTPTIRAARPQLPEPPLMPERLKKTRAYLLRP